MPNAWDSASAITMARSGAPAVATTSSGFAATFGRTDYAVEADQLLTHSALLARTATVPVSVDSERCYGSTPAAVTSFAEELAGTGVAGFSIEDYNPATASIESIEVSTERVAAAAEVATARGLVLTARAERHLYEQNPDFDDTIARLRAYAEAGAGCVYAPGLSDPDQIAAVCAIGPAVNVLLTPKTPSVPELAALGVRRVSTGGALLRVALGETQRAVEELLDTGTLGYMDKAISGGTFNGWLDG